MGNIRDRLYKCVVYVLVVEYVCLSHYIYIYISVLAGSKADGFRDSSDALI